MTIKCKVCKECWEDRNRTNHHLLLLAHFYPHPSPHLHHAVRSVYPHYPQGFGWPLKSENQLSWGCETVGDFPFSFSPVLWDKQSSNVRNAESVLQFKKFESPNILLLHRLTIVMLLFSECKLTFLFTIRIYFPRSKSL